MPVNAEQLRAALLGWGVAWSQAELMRERPDLEKAIVQFLQFSENSRQGGPGLVGAFLAFSLKQGLISDADRQRAIAGRDDQPRDRPEPNEQLDGPKDHRTHQSR